MNGRRNDYCGAIALGVGVPGAWHIYQAFELRRYIREIVAWSNPEGGMAFAVNFIVFESFAVALAMGAIATIFWLCSWFMRPIKRRMPTLLQALGLVSFLPFIYTLLRMLLGIVRGILGV